MASGKDWAQNILVILFAAAIVALGADELYRRHQENVRSGAGTAGSGMVKELLGPDVKARLSPEAVQESIDRQEAAREEREAQPTDEDRSELGSLVEDLFK